jgi:hypothetical protein
MRFSFLVLCHQRTTHLQKVIDNLKSVRGIENCNVLFIAHSASEEVLSVISNSNIPNFDIHRIDQDFPSAKAAINNSTRTGCEIVFSNQDVDACIVLEDDICIAEDVLEFAAVVSKHHSKSSRYRGINFYSVDTSPDSLDFDYVRLNYSFGWGWLIPRKTFNRLNFWTGKEDAHWDYLIEPYIRTGYLISPVLSKVKNIGFDSTATHTGSETWISRKMSLSYDLSKSKSSTFANERKGSYEVIRRDCLVISNLSKFDILKLIAVRKASYVMYRIALLGSKRVHFLWRESRNRIDNHFANRLRINED